MWLVSPWHVDHIIASQAGSCSNELAQGGSVAAAFAASFPHLINERVAFLAAAGLMDVRLEIDSSKAGLVATAAAETSV